MSQKTETDLHELKDLIQALDKKIDLGFANVNTKFAKLEGRIDTLESKIVAVDTTVKSLDNRLWVFRGLVLAPTLAALLAIFVRQISLDNIKF
jgi:hypothetical protein